jgi:pyridoxine 5-phosphate synthase
MTDADRGAVETPRRAGYDVMRLYVNIDHVATVREARRTDEPDPVRAAVLAELGGADGITVHLREDRRHIQDRDVRLLMETVRTGVNLELAATSEIVDLACELKPMQVTLVPEKREEITTEGGLALDQGPQLDNTRAALERLAEAGIRTSLFIDPGEDVIKTSLDLGVAAVELHTGEYANAGAAERETQIDRLNRAASLARKLGLDVHAGHGLTYENVAPVAAIPEIEELNIGHSIIARSVFTGIERAVHEMDRTIRRARRRT